MTDVPLKDYLESLLKEQDRRIEQAQEAAHRAVTKAELAVDKRLDLLNEFRAQFADESRKYSTKESYEALDRRIEKLERIRDIISGGVTVVMFVGALAFAIVKLFWST